MSLAARERPSDVPCDPPTTAVVVVQGDTELDEWPLAAGEWPDLALVDYLARLQLAARRRGYSIRVRHAPAALVELLRLAGLSTVVPETGDGLPVEVGRQAEGGEEPGVEERSEL